MGDRRTIVACTPPSNIFACWPKVLFWMLGPLISRCMNVPPDVCFFLPPFLTSKQLLGQFFSRKLPNSKANCVEISKTYSHSNSSMNLGLIILPYKLSLFFEPGHHLSYIVNIWIITHCHQWHLLPLHVVPILTSPSVWEHS